MAESLADIVRSLWTRIRVGVRVAVSGEVVTFDPYTGTVTALPSVSESDGRGNVVPSVQVHKVPVIMPGGATRGITFGLDADDRVLMVVRHRSHDEVDGGTEALPVTPQANRRMNYADSVALPGYVPPEIGRPSAHVRSDGQLVVYMGSSEAMHVGDSMAAIALARADRTDAQLEEIRNLLKSWTTVPNDGGLALQTMAKGMWLTSSPTTATDRVKVDK